jgi:hypothetical protein
MLNEDLEEKMGQLIARAESRPRLANGGLRLTRDEKLWVWKLRIHAWKLLPHVIVYHALGELILFLTGIGLLLDFLFPKD